MNIVLATSGPWQFSLRTVSASGLVILGAYFAAAIICLSARQYAATDSAKGFWLLMALMLMALGCNKELDLHVLLVQTLRKSLFDQHGSALRIFSLAALLGSVTAAIVLMCRKAMAAMRYPNPELLAGFIAFIALSLVLTLRFGPIEAVSHFLSTHLTQRAQGLWHSHVVELFEFPLIVLIAVVAWCFRKKALLRATTVAPAQSRTATLSL